MRHRLYHERDARTRAGSNAMGGVYAAVASVLLVGATAGVLALADSSAPTVDAQVVFAAAPPAMTSLAANAVAVQSPSFDAVPDVDAESVSPNEAEAGGHDPHVASPEGWPVYSRGAAAVAFPVSHTTLVIRPADFRPMTARAPVAPILVRH